MFVSLSHSQNNFVSFQSSQKKKIFYTSLQDIPKLTEIHEFPMLQQQAKKGSNPKTMYCARFIKGKVEEFVGFAKHSDVKIWDSFQFASF